MFEHEIRGIRAARRDWKRTNKMRSALLHAQILQLARAASQAPGPAPGNASKGDGE